MKNLNIKAEASISEKLSKSDIPREEKEIIIENGLRFGILESENEMKKIDFEIRNLEKDFGMLFKELEEVGLPN